MADNREHSWTDARIAELKLLWSEGKSCSQIADALGEGVTRNAVIGKVSRLKLGKRLARPVKSNLLMPVGRNGRAGKDRGTHHRAQRARGNEARPAKIRTSPLSVMMVPGEPAMPDLTYTRSDAWSPLPGSKPVPLHEHVKGCKWPVDGAEGQKLFCNEPLHDAGPYCRVHFKLSLPRK